MSRRARHLAIVLASLLLAPLGAPSAAGAADREATEGDKVLVQLKLQHAGKTHEHPGYMAVLGEETILELTAGEHSYEVSIELQKNDGKWSLAVTFVSDGKEVLSGKKDGAKPKSWLEFGKGKASAVSIRFDPSAKRTDEVDLPGGNAPLDGVE